MKRYGLMVVAMLAVGILAGCTSKSSVTATSPAITELASCLTSKGATFYGTNWCPHCQAQKALFGSAVSEVNFVDCDANKVACSTANVQGYPTWVFADGSQLVGTQSLEALAAKAGCTFAPEALVADEQQAAVQQAAVASGQ